MNPLRMDLDFNVQPLLVIWEVTRSCALACQHCRASAEDRRDPRELTLAEGTRLLGQIHAMGTPLVVFTGGDPLQRDDLEDLVRAGKATGLRVAAIAATTPRLTQPRLASLQAAGLDQLAISLDGPTAELHDGFRRVPGCFDIAIRAAGEARALGLPLQVNTVFAAWNAAHFDAMAALVQQLGVVFWEVFFLVPTGRGAEMAGCTPAQFDELFAKLHAFSQQVDFIVKVTEAPHYRVHVLQHGGGPVMGHGRARHPGAAHPGGKPPGASHAGAPPAGAAPASLPSAHHAARGGLTLSRTGVNAGKGFCFVDHVGEVYPSGFLPILCGNVRTTDIATIYRDAPLFRELRDATLLKGWCGRCPHRELCGGSRARAYALTGDYQAQEPSCSLGPTLPIAAG